MKISDGMKQLTDAAGSALSDIRVSSGKTVDKDLMRYESMSDQDFDSMAESFGQENVLQYIKDMEVRRISENSRR